MHEILNDLITHLASMLRLSKITDERINKLEARQESMLTILTNTISVMQHRINELEGKKNETSV
jgi:hypothetical protein